jgi:hypothetical protein
MVTLDAVSLANPADDDDDDDDDDGSSASGEGEATIEDASGAAA